MKQNQEERLLWQIRQKDRTAMAAFYSQHAPYLYAVCRRYLADNEDAKDALQETFIKIFSSIDTFKPRAGGTIRAWTTRVAINCSLNHIRNSRKLLFIEAKENIDDNIPDDSIEADPLPAEALQQMIVSLPIGYRTVFNLFAIEGMSHKEIAKTLGISESTSASQYHRAKALMKRKIKEYISSNPIKQ